MAKTLSSLNGYEVVDKTARDKINDIVESSSENYILNGGFQINQRNQKTVYSSAGYTLDGWKIEDNITLEKKSNSILVTNTGTSSSRFNPFIISNGLPRYVNLKILSGKKITISAQYFDSDFKTVYDDNILESEDQLYGIYHIYFEKIPTNTSILNLYFTLDAGESIELEYVQLYTSKQNFIKKTYKEDLEECKLYHFNSFAAQSDGSMFAMNAALPCVKIGDYLYITTPIKMKSTNISLIKSTNLIVIGIDSNGKLIPAQTLSLDFDMSGMFDVSISSQFTDDSIIIKVASKKLSTQILIGIAYFESDFKLGQK